MNTNIISRKSIETTTIKFPIILFEKPINFSLAIVNHYWVTTSNAEILVHKWYESDLSLQYMPQATSDENVISHMALANDLLPMSFCQINVLYLPLYLAKTLIEDELDELKQA